MLVPLSACSGDKASGGGTDSGATDGGDGGDGGGGGGDDGGSDTWRPAGSGLAFLVDGTEGNSLFTLQVNFPPLPRDGEAYYGWLSGGADGPVALGEIPVDNADQILFETDIGFNGLLAGYDTFTAYAGTGPDADSTGELLWTGTIDPSLRTSYEQLLIADEETPDGSGSVRTVSDTVTTIRDLTDDTINNVSDLAGINVRGETIANTIRGASEDLNDDGTVSILEDTMPILGEEGLIELILDDLAVASASVDPGHPVKDLANWAYDCTQRIQSYAIYAANRAGVASVCGAEASCDEVLYEALTNLNWALEGQDGNGDSEIDPIEEGTVDCAVFFVSQMAYMEVTTP
jgi:hypothetical protein